MVERNEVPPIRREGDQRNARKQAGARTARRGVDGPWLTTIEVLAELTPVERGWWDKSKRPLPDVRSSEAVELLEWQRDRLEDALRRLAAERRAGRGLPPAAPAVVLVPPHKPPKPSAPKVRRKAVA